tara:strand:- start:501 stop:1214 length:714 start_codon:yes stop_codon:yes gene_type:complete
MLRSLFFNFFFYFGVIIVITIAIPALIMPNSITLWLGKFLGNWTIFCLKFFLKTKINVIGKENIIKNENFFVASAHQSIFETFFLQTIINSPIFILKKELLKMPIFGWYLKKINSIAIDRNITTKENLSFFDTIVKTINKTKRPLIIFPQGTRTPSQIKTPFKKGVARIYEHLNIKCLPIALNSGNVWPKNGPMIPNSVITVSILKPIDAKIEKNYFLKTLEENIYNEIDKINNLNN